MKNIKNYILGIIFLVIIIVILSFLVKFIIEATQLFFDLPVELSTGMLATATTIIVSVLSITIGKYFERKRKIEFELREKKIPIYQGFMDFSSRLFGGEKAGNKKIPQKEMIKYFNSFTYELMIWGSDDVIKSWSDFRLKAIENNKKSGEEDKNVSEENNEEVNNASLDLMVSYEKLLLTIRKDIGHKNRGFEQGILLRMFINDYDDYKKN